MNIDSRMCNIRLSMTAARAYVMDRVTTAIRKPIYDKNRQPVQKAIWNKIGVRLPRNVTIDNRVINAQLREYKL